MNVFAFLGNVFVPKGFKLQFMVVIFVLLSGLTGFSADEKNEGNPFIGIAGGDILSISLKNAIFMALERNPTVTIQRMEPEKAKTFVSEQREMFDPVLSASGNQSKTKLQRFLGSQPEPFKMTWDRFNYDVEISETLPTGTTLSANVSMTGSESSIYSDQFSGIVGLSVTQALLQGFGIGVNMANLRKANIDVEISKAELKGVAEQITANVEKAYWGLYLAAEEMNIQKKSLELADRQLQESLERVEVGRLPELELAAVHAEVATRKGALIDSQSRYEQSRLQFLYLLNPAGRDIWSTVPVLVDKPFVPEDTLDVISIHEQLGMKYRPDLQQARFTLQKGELDIVQTKNGLLPRLDFFITFGRTSYAQTFNDAIPDPQSPFYDTNAGLTFYIPVPKRKARAQVLRARRSYDQMELSVHNMERMVQWDVRSAYIEVMRSKEQIEATKVARELQERKLDAEQEKFRVGKSTNFLVLQAQRDFTASQLDEAGAVVSYLDALVNLQLMEGTLLARRGINAPFDTITE